MVEYSYIDDTDKLNAHRPDHRTYLETLVSSGQMLAFGRFGSDGPAGALLIVEAPSADSVELLLADDPFKRHGLIGSHRVREWIATWGNDPS